MKLLVPVDGNCGPDDVVYVLCAEIGRGLILRPLAPRPPTLAEQLPIRLRSVVTGSS